MTDTVPVPVRLDVESLLPDLERTLTRLGQVATKAADRVALPHGLRNLLKLRASQLNGCAYCVDMHTKDAQSVGESIERIAAVPVWRETPLFTATERAALAFVEAVTTMTEGHVPDEAYAAVAAEWEPEGVAALLALAVSINAWNTLGVAARPWEVGSYQP